MDFSNYLDRVARVAASMLRDPDSLARLALSGTVGVLIGGVIAFGLGWYLRERWNLWKLRGIGRTFEKRYRESRLR